MRQILIFIATTFILVSCRKDKVQEVTITPEECPETISYTNDIQPFLDINCSTSGCHDSNTGSAGYVLEQHSQVEEHAEIILSVIRHESGFSAMPQGGPKLPDSTIQKMECWIGQGKLFN
tara:strand:+ start:20504 stop:20863 length:360 start_codon:yes stop_codon:yes gene_type:complete